jgi:hypothetical protein
MIRQLTLQMTAKQTSTALLAFMLAFSWVTPAFAKNKCQDLFTVDLEPVYRAELQQLVRSHYSIEQKQNFVSDLFLKYGLREFKLKYMESPKDIRRGISETEHLFNVASRFTGEHTNLSPEIRWLEREVLARGIDSLVLKYRDVPERHIILVLIRKILKSRLVQFAQNFRNLPYRNDKVIPEELFEKIMRDGVTPHEKELLEFYDTTNQDRIDQYRQIRKIYATFFILLLSYTTWNQLGTVDEKVNAAKFEKTIKGLEELQDFADALDMELSRRGLYKD